MHKQHTRLHLYVTKACTRCHFTAGSIPAIIRHFYVAHKGFSECSLCHELFKNKQSYHQHLDNVHLEYINTDLQFIIYQQMWNRHIIYRLIFPNEDEKSLELMIYLKYRSVIKEQLKVCLDTFKFIKVLFVCNCVFYKLNAEGDVVDVQVLVVLSGPFVVFTQYDYFHFSDFIDLMAQKVVANLDILETTGSGLIMSHCSSLDMRVAVPALLPGAKRTLQVFAPKAKALRGGCQLQKDAQDNYIQTYEKYDMLRSCIRDYSNANEETCFLYAVAGGMILQQNPALAQSSTKLAVLTKEYVKTHFMPEKNLFKRFSFPFHIKDINRFEKLFSHLNVAINVWTFNKEHIWVLYQSKQPKHIPRIDILLQQPAADIDSSVGHYVTIVHVPAFLRVFRVHFLKDTKTTTETNNAFRQTEYYYCDLCNHSFSSKSSMKSHVNVCKNNNYQKIQYPKKGDVFEFDPQSNKQYKSEYLVFADFEAKMDPVTNEQNYSRHKCDNCRGGGQVRHCNHAERELMYQDPMTYSVMVFTTNGQLIFSRTESHDEQCMDLFFTCLDDVQEKLKHGEYRDIYWSTRQQKIFEKETKCHICKGDFLPGNPKGKLQKVRDHCHNTPPVQVNYNGHTVYESKYLGAAHKECNIKRTNPETIPVYIHNFMAYDSNFILRYLRTKKNISEAKLKALPYNNNKFRTLQIGQWMFLDSYQMLNGSLASLVDNLVQDKTNFNLVRQNFPSHLPVDLLFKKAAYPYEWVTSVEQLLKATKYPDYDSFKSSLSFQNIPKDHYIHGQTVFEAFHCRQMLDYTELYCALDTLLLAEVVFSFRNEIYSAFELAIEKYISLPQLSFDACLKTIGHPIEKITDPNMVVMFESAIRGGVSFVNNRHEQILDSNKSSIMYLDANNLYGWAQSMYLPIGEYSFVPEQSIPFIDWVNIPANADYGFAIECDLEFPEHLHSTFDDLPLAPYHNNISFTNLSPYSQHVQTQLSGSKRAQRYSRQKLLSDVQPKKRYFCHYMALKLYLELGARLTNIHSVIKFKQADFLKPFIKFASSMRAKSKTKFAQNLWKLLANSLYGKFIQDKRKYTKVVFCNSDTHLARLIRSPYFMNVEVVNENLCMVTSRHEKCLLDRLYSIGFSILELSKVFMYTTWYKVIRPTFDNTPELILTDTDSFVIKFPQHSKQAVLRKLSHCMDFSNFPTSSPFFSDKVKKIPGYFKDEYPAHVIKEAVALRSKCYYLRMEPDPHILSDDVTEQAHHTVCKGISNAVSQKFPIELYKACIYKDDVIVKSSMTRIRAKKRKLATVTVTKTVMSSGDDKRFQTCARHSVPYGSKYVKLDYCNKCTSETQQ